MSSNLGELSIKASALAKCYHLYANPLDRLKHFFFKERPYGREFWALRDASFEVSRGEVLGIVGQNGAGKSTVLQLVCGTVAPTSGSLTVDGRIAALLELGAGFNPDFTGRENVYLAASILGLSNEEIDARYNQIVEFSGIGDFVDNPVKTYSSGMYVRLAFSVATNVDPDILVIDEALSVGDGEFARKSFDRIMDFKKAGKTILFCSHSLYQVEAICSRVIWLDHGIIRMQGRADEVVGAYNDYLNGTAVPKAGEVVSREPQSANTESRLASLKSITVTVDGRSGRSLRAVSGKDDVEIDVVFASDPTMPCPHVAGGFMWQDGRIVCSASTFFEQIQLERTADGMGRVRLIFNRLPLLKGSYWVAVYLFCENGIHVYDCTNTAAEIAVRQDSLEQGVVSLPHSWKL